MHHATPATPAMQAMQAMQAKIIRPFAALLDVTKRLDPARLGQLPGRGWPHGAGRTASPPTARLLALLFCGAFLATTPRAAPVATAAKVIAPTSAAEVGVIRPGSEYLKGYLEASALPNSLALLPRPPEPGSAAQQADETTWRALNALKPGARWALARADAELLFPQASAAFACALGQPISEQATPHLNMLLRRSLADAGLATYKAKNHYQRQRPFASLGLASCTPDEEAKLSKDGSYPSGHAAVGWAWALLLAELAPQRADALLQRGRSFGQSRGVCGVHWPTDIEAGRLVGAAAVARLQSNPVFLAQRDAARAEIAPTSTAAPSPACLAQAAAQALSQHLVP